MTPLLDTHILLWWMEKSPRLSAAQERVLSRVTPDRPAWVSEITLWEIATLVSLGRVRLGLPLREWLERAVAPPLVRRSGISPAVAAEVAALPDAFHRDPADRVIVATTRILGATLLTQDQRLLDADLVTTVS